ncbi:MAG: hypothetical protein ACK4K9_09285 [Bacteroidia bacterium]
MKQLIDLKNWNFFRTLRLVFAIIAFVAFTKTHENLYALLGLLLIIQVIFNMGCGVGSCANYQVRKQENNNNEITYEEIK